MGFKTSRFYRYHVFTKHTYQKLMTNRHSLDWANQPDPFRRYPGSELVDLPTDFPATALSLFDVLFPALPVPRTPFTLQSLSTFLYYSMAISAWKHIPGTDVSWALRVNPSSGNLHPTETHLVVRSVEGLPPGLYHYRVQDHKLERRNLGGPMTVSLAGAGLAPEMDGSPVSVVLGSIFWREAWKYQWRAFRYCCHDMAMRWPRWNFRRSLWGGTPGPRAPFRTRG